MRFLIFVLIFALIPTAAFAGVEKVDVCHITDDVAKVGHVINIADPAYDSHVAHGDPVEWELFIQEDGTEACREVTSVCPTTLTPNGIGWFVSDEFSGVNSIWMQVTLISNGPKGIALAFDPITDVGYQLWTEPSIYTPLVLNLALPSGIYPQGSTFSYSLNIMNPGATGDNVLAFRVKDQNFGTLAPFRTPLQSVSFTCN